MAGKDDERRVLAAMKDEMAGGFRAGVLLSSPVDVIGHKRVEPSQTIPDPCSDPSSSDDKKVPHVSTLCMHTACYGFVGLLRPSYIYAALSTQATL